jgi:pimeloyl-ACP methyl ester carboxylesterase
MVPNRRTGQLMPLGVAALRDLRSHRDEYDVEAAARMHGRPWLIVHGTADDTVPVAAAHRLASWARPGTAELHLLAGADHALDCAHPFRGPSAALLEAEREMLAFLGRTLK